MQMSLVNNLAYGPRQSKKSLRVVAKCADSHHPAHPGIWSQFIHSIVSNYHVCGQ